MPISNKFQFSLKKINFSYDINNVINDLSISFYSGEKIALVGSSGSGKTTLCNLIMGFYDCFYGDILIDNYSLYANLAINIRKAYSQYYHLLNKGGYFLANCFGKKTTGFNTGIKIDSNTFRNIERGVLKDRGVTTFWDREELNNMFREIGYQIVKIENVAENRNSVFIEKHITYLMK